MWKFHTRMAGAGLDVTWDRHRWVSYITGRVLTRVVSAAQGDDWLTRISETALLR